MKALYERDSERSQKTYSNLYILRRCQNDQVHDKTIKMKELRAFRGYFAPHPYEAKKINSLFIKFFLSMAKVYKSDISLIFTVAMVTKMATTIGLK